MRKTLTLTLIGACAAFSSCSSDKDDPIFESKVYDYAGTQLTVSSNGSAVYGKKATLATLPDNQALITVEGEDFDLTPYVSSVSEMIPSLPTVIPTSGVLPGSASTSFTVLLGKDGSFSGTSETEYCTYSYSGTFSESELTCSFSDVKLKDTSLAGSYAPATAIDEWFGEEVADGFHFVWESTDSVNIEIFEGYSTKFPIGTMVQLALSVATGSNPAEQVNKHLQTMTFGEDGNVTITYQADESEPSLTSPLNVCQYVRTSANEIRAFLNPAAIVASTEASKSRDGEDSVDLNALVESLAANYVPMVRNGIPVATDLVEDSLTVYLNKDFMDPLLTAAGAVLSVPSIQQLIIDMATEQMPDMASMIQGIIPQLPAAIKGTTEFEVGLKMVKQ